MQLFFCVLSEKIAMDDTEKSLLCPLNSAQNSRSLTIKVTFSNGQLYGCFRALKGERTACESDQRCPFKQTSMTVVTLGTSQPQYVSPRGQFRVYLCPVTERGKWMVLKKKHAGSVCVCKCEWNWIQRRPLPHFASFPVGSVLSQLSCERDHSSKKPKKKKKLRGCRRVCNTTTRPAKQREAENSCLSLDMTVCVS